MTNKNIKLNNEKCIGFSTDCRNKLFNDVLGLSSSGHLVLIQLQKYE